MVELYYPTRRYGGGTRGWCMMWYIWPVVHCISIRPPSYMLNYDIFQLHWVPAAWTFCPNSSRNTHDCSRPFIATNATPLPWNPWTEENLSTLERMDPSLEDGYMYEVRKMSVRDWTWIDKYPHWTNVIWVMTDWLTISWADNFCVSDFHEFYAELHFRHCFTFSWSSVPWPVARDVSAQSQERSVV